MMLNLFASTIAFIVAAYFIWRYLYDRGFEGKGLKSTVVMLASVVSWAAGSGAEWIANKIDPPPVHAKAAHQNESSAAVRQLINSMR